MFGVTHHTPATTSLAALSAASFVGFGFNQLAQAEPMGSSGYPYASNRDGNQWPYSDVNHVENSQSHVKSYQEKFSGDSHPHALLKKHNSVPRSSDDSSGVIELSSLDGKNGFQVNGITKKNNQSGYSVSGAGDVNGDGYGDVIIGARFADPHGVAYAGESYVVFGKASGFRTVELSSLDGVNGFQINGISSSDQSGRSVSGAGDVNGDGYDDIIIGAYRADPHGKDGAGESYVVFGKASDFGTIELSSLDGINGFQINGISSGDDSGYSVSGAGDVNADGYDDIIVGARYADSHGVTKAGESYVVFGKASGFGTIELSSLDGVNGFQINGISSGDFSGRSVSGAGDVNHDGYADIVIGAYKSDPNGIANAGESYVVFGKASDFGNIELSSLDGVNGFQINGISSGDYSGYSVSGAGDVNADGYDDIIIGAYTADPHDISVAGESYVVFGKASDFGTIELSSLDGVNGFQLNGIASYDKSGCSVSGAGDMNGDGYADVIIGAYDADPNGKSGAGESYVVFGKASDFGTIELSSLDGVNGFQLNGISSFDLSGISVSQAGDMNGDGCDDIVIGAFAADPHGINAAGESYLIFGGTGISVPTPTPTPVPNLSYPESINVSNLNGETGSIFRGGGNRALMGNSVSRAGDINVDGIGDVIVGASGTRVNYIPNAGSGYVVFGTRDEFPANTSVTKLTGKNGFTLVAQTNEMAFSTSVSGIGDVNQDGIDDVVVGSPYGMNALNIQTGKAYVVYGSGDIFSQTVNVTQLDGSNGFGIEGDLYSDKLGFVVSDAGDINRNGESNFMVSAPYATVGNQTEAGKVYVIFGDYRGYPSIFNVAALNGSNGFVVTGGNAFEHMGESLSSIGDINGDGIGDIAIGAPEATVNDQYQVGKVYVIFGSCNGFGSEISVNSLNGTNGFSLNGAQPFDNFGASVSWSKVNDDRLSDIIIGAPNAQNSDGLSSGRVYVFYGKSGEYLPQYNISLITPESGFILDGEQVSDKAGASVSGIGDFNVDGLQDILIGAPQATANNQPRAGKGYVVFGQRGDYPSTIALSSLDGNNGFTIEGEKFGDNLGSSVSGAGDMNQDGAPDVLLGAPGEDNGGTGYTALVYGGVSLFSDARQGQSLRAQNNNTPNQPLAAANDVAPVEMPAFKFN